MNKTAHIDLIAREVPANRVCINGEAHSDCNQYKELMLSHPVHRAGIRWKVMIYPTYPRLLASRNRPRILTAAASPNLRRNPPIH